ncbi:toxin co-regulated pilus biosynthesis Q family protein [Pseudoalteromonas sp. OFAV1]|jgi:hypothetical protein|uniref:toxin co-regulated pilus biosynthesis Q family protein n=1 Tax=Pseudoalteromonas sp. OFAV1 TaxID=2908892 RepID=UPI001F373310|nr:toxin co-regulated pilus biosynthesis Q family protein [Pseudoalteromonas sp. OFAV1]MCF2901211.1 toxin co-regulated pilus biosynthesis Q family protein [Pseudoalteromonas sp. OFAV1]
MMSGLLSFKVIPVVSVSLSALLFAADSNASLYVSPVVKDEAVINYNTSKKVTNEDQQHAVSVVDNKVDIVMTSGKELPLHVAVDNIVPLKQYKVHFEDGIHDMEITWSGGNDWRDVLHVLCQQNNLSVFINEKEKVVGISAHKDLALHLAKKVPTVWVIDTNKSLRENLEDWAKKAGWQVDWAPSLEDVDYDAPHSSLFTGNFVGKGGVVEELLTAYSDGDTPLSPKFYLKNRVLLITKGGHKQSLSF